MRRLKASANNYGKSQTDAGRDVRARAWRFIFDAYERKQRTPPAPNATDHKGRTCGGKA